MIFGLSYREFGKIDGSRNSVDRSARSARQIIQHFLNTQLRRKARILERAEKLNFRSTDLSQNQHLNRMFYLAWNLNKLSTECVGYL